MTDGEDPRGAPDASFVVDPQRPAGRGRSRAAAAVLVVVVVIVSGLTAWGLLSRARVGPGPGPPSAAAAPSSTGPSTAPSLGPQLSFPAVDAAGIPVLQVADEDEAFAALATMSGWRICPMWRGVASGGTVTAAAIDAALAAGARGSGMIRVADPSGVERRVWVRGTEVDAARGFGATAIAIAGRATWTAVVEGASWAVARLLPVDLPESGRRAWQLTDRATPAPYCEMGSVAGLPADVLRVHVVDPLRALIDASAWSSCRTWARTGIGRLPTGEDVDAAARTAGLTAADASGWVSVPVAGRIPGWTLPVWTGADPAIAASQLGSHLVAIDAGEPATAWLAVDLDGDPGAVMFRVVRTPAGRIAWLPTSNAAGTLAGCGGVDDASPAAAG